jgi:hypothetical protein
MVMSTLTLIVISGVLMSAITLVGRLTLVLSEKTLDRVTLSSVPLAAHEVPQELGDFGVLVYSGWARRKALLVRHLVGPPRGRTGQEWTDLNVGRVVCYEC